jgi:hypothetical protein
VRAEVRLGEGKAVESSETVGKIAVDTAFEPHYNTATEFRYWVFSSAVAD